MLIAHYTRLKSEANGSTGKREKSQPFHSEMGEKDAYSTLHEIEK